jgi:hypothetical protein
VRKKHPDHPDPFIFAQTTKAEDDIMYLETGLGQRSKPLDVFDHVTIEWNLAVPFTTDFKLFRQEVVLAINRHVGARKDRAKIDPALNEARNRESLNRSHTFRSLNRGSAFVIVKVALGFKSRNYTDLRFVTIDPTFTRTK